MKKPKKAAAKFRYERLTIPAEPEKAGAGPRFRYERSTIPAEPEKAGAGPKPMRTCAGCPMPSKCTAAGKCLAGDKGKALY